MSKSKGNVVDPLIVIDEFGTDALRFTLLVGSTPGNDVNLSLKKVEGNRNFANKIWNASRFVISAINSLDPTPQLPSSLSPLLLSSLADRWIIARLRALVREVERLFQSFQYGEAGRQIYEFFWGDFADWYVEIAKLQMADGRGQTAESEGGNKAVTTVQTLASVLDTCLRLLHPFIPFITEELWGHLRRAIENPPSGYPPALIVAPWPAPTPMEDWETEALTTFSLVQDAVRAIRNLRAEKGVRPGQLIPATFIAKGEVTSLLEGQLPVMAMLAGLDPTRTAILRSFAGEREGYVSLVVGAMEIFLPLAGLMNMAEERARLAKELAETEAQISRLETLFAGPFAQKAPPPVVQKERDKLAAYGETAAKLRSQIQALG
jgi:valyl-tRNA synthetase